MKDLPKEFTTSNLHSFHSLAALVATASIFLIGVLDFITGEKVVGSTFASMFLLPWFLIVLLIKLTSKVKFERDYIEKRTLSGNVRIKWT